MKIVGRIFHLLCRDESPAHSHTRTCPASLRMIRVMMIHQGVADLAGDTERTPCLKLWMTFIIIFLTSHLKRLLQVMTMKLNLTSSELYLLKPSIEMVRRISGSAQLLKCGLEGLCTQDVKMAFERPSGDRREPLNLRSCWKAWAGRVTERDWWWGSGITSLAKYREGH